MDEWYCRDYAPFCFFETSRGYRRVFIVNVVELKQIILHLISLFKVAFFYMIVTFERCCFHDLLLESIYVALWLYGKYSNFDHFIITM